jgi:hypothetical protein
MFILVFIIVLQHYGLLIRMPALELSVLVKI